jgi:hypothetical protein
MLFDGDNLSIPLNGFEEVEDGGGGKRAVTFNSIEWIHGQRVEREARVIVAPAFNSIEWILD